MKIKKYHKQLSAICLLLLLTLILILINFDFLDNKSDNKKKSPKSCDIAFITYDSIDKSYEALIKEGIDSAANALDKTYRVFSVNDYGNSYEKTIQAAISSSAPLVILPDSTFEEAVYACQTHYVSTYFMLIDGVPHNTDYNDSTINYNVLPMSYDEAEAGFLAGYAAVYDNYKSLCFVCDESSGSLRCCYGFLQGADYASSENGKTDISISIIDESSETFMNDIPADTDLIIASSDEAVEQLLKNSTTKNIPLINCDNCSTHSRFVIATATKNITPTVNDTILDFFNNQKKGGTILKFDTSNNGISFTYDTEAFQNFNESVYKKIYNMLAMQKITIISDTTVSPEDLELTNISIVNNLPVS